MKHKSKHELWLWYDVINDCPSKKSITVNKSKKEAMQDFAKCRSQIMLCGSVRKSQFVPQWSQLFLQKPDLPLHAHNCVSQNWELVLSSKENKIVNSNGPLSFILGWTLSNAILTILSSCWSVFASWQIWLLKNSRFLKKNQIQFQKLSAALLNFKKL